MDAACAEAADNCSNQDGMDPTDILPVELWTNILNGCDGRRGLLFLDPRFRFAGRATCALWSAIVQRPGPDFAAALNAPPWRCQTACTWPKHPWYLALADGRAVCMSALVTMLARSTGGWREDPAAFMMWFASHVTRATQHHAALVMLMSPAARAVEHVCEVEAHRADSASEGQLFDVLARGLERLKRGHVYRAFQTRLCDEQSRITVALARLADAAIENEHVSLLQQIATLGRVINSRHRELALRASGPACFACIVDCHPSCALSEIHDRDLAAKVFCQIVGNGRHWALDLLRTQRRTLCRADVFAEAMTQGAVSSLDWLDDRHGEWMNASIVSLTITAVKEPSFHDERSFGWICDRMHSRFGPADRGALFGAIVAGRHVRLLLFLLDKHFFRVNAKVITRAFAVCLDERDHLRSVCALLRTADALFGGRPSDVDLWGRVIVPNLYDKRNIRANCIARILCAIALGARADHGDVHVLEGTHEACAEYADGQCWCNPQTEAAASQVEQLLRWCRPVARFAGTGAERLYDRGRLPTRTYMALHRLAVSNSTHPFRPDPRDPDPPLFY